MTDRVLVSLSRKTVRDPTGGTKIGFCEDRQRQGRAGKRVRMGGYLGPAWTVLLWRHAHHQKARAHRRALRREVSVKWVS